jgi:hypothetical protein
MTPRFVGVEGSANIAGVEKPEEFKKVTEVSLICSSSRGETVSTDYYA